jgi:heme/copper-type cytochrome/quinol oxidase subunit 2
MRWSKERRIVTARTHGWGVRACGVLTLLAALLYRASASAQCALCKTSLASAGGSDGGARLADGIFWSTIAIVGTSLTVMTLIGVLLFRAYRRNGMGAVRL